jgi:hypothetical protein
MAIVGDTMMMTGWAVAVAIAAIAAAVFLMRGSDGRRRIIAVCVGLVAVAAIVAPELLRVAAGDPQAMAEDPATERRALERRRIELTARAAQPGSPLACLDALAGEPVESACEQAVFANPASIAAAVSYAAAQLRLLAEAAAYASRGDPSYTASFADFRLAAENDAYGIYAHVLATREGCTAQQCDAFVLLRDSSSLKEHLQQRLYANYVAKHRDRWRLPVTLAAPAHVASVAPAATVRELPELAGSMAAIAALAPSMPAATEVTPPPLPKARPVMTMAATTGPPATATPGVAPAAAEAEPTPARPRPVPPIASKLPRIDFPSASSIPAISIMAPEPKLPPAETTPAQTAPSTAPKPSSSAQ